MKKQLYIVLFLAAFGGFLVYAYTYFQQFSEDRITAISAVPQDAAFVVEFANFSDTWNRFSNTNMVWSDLLSLGYGTDINFQINIADTLVAESPFLSGIHTHSPLVVSFHPQAGSSSLLLTWQHAVSLHNKELKQALEGISNVSKVEDRQIGGQSGIQFQIRELGAWYAFAHANLLLVSNSLATMESAIKKLNSQATDENNQRLVELKALSGKNTQVRIFANFDQAKRIFANNISADGIRWMGSTTPAKWTEADLITLPGGFSLQAYSIMDTASAITNYRGQIPTHISATTYIPQKAIAFMHFSVSDYEMLYNQIQHSTTHQQASNKSASIDLLSTVGNWIGDELAVFYTAGDNKIQKHVLAKTSGLANPMGLLQADVQDSALVNRGIYTLKEADLLETAFGKLFRYNETVYFTTLSDYILFGTDTSAFTEIKSWSESGRTFAYDEDYVQFSTNYLQEKSNILFYGSLYNLFQIASSGLNEETNAQLERNKDLLQKFSAVSWQSKVIDQRLMYHNVNLVYNGQAKVKSNILWQAKLEADVAGRAWYIKNHRTNTHEILVQDVNHKLYQISATGKIQWTRQLDGKILGDVQQVDIFNNAKFQTLLTAADKLYLIDVLGNNVSGFPVKLPAQATSAPSAIDYEHKKDYRFVLACGEKLFNYDKSGKPVEGWDFKPAKHRIDTAPVHFVVEGKDYIANYDTAGNIYMVDRRGAVRHQLNKTIQLNGTPRFVKGKTLATTRVMYTDSANAIRQVFMDGKESLFLKDSSLQAIHFRIVTQNEGFLYLAVPARQRVEFYSADGNVQELLNMSFKRIDYFSLTTLGSRRVSMILDKTANEVQVSVKSASGEKAYYFDAETTPSVLDMNNDGTLNLLTTKTKFVLIYSLQ